jgi:PEP-CTERM motif-containing protein
MKFSRLITPLATTAISVLTSGTVFASHVPGISFSGDPFQVNPAAVGEAFPTFTAGALNFSYTAEMDQTAGTGTGGPGSTSTFSQSGVANISAFLNHLGGDALAAGDTGLNLSSTTTAGYGLFTLVNGTGSSTVNSDGGINGVYSTFGLSFFVDKDNDSSINCPGDAASSGSCILADASPGDDILVLTGTLIVGQGGFHLQPGIVGGDFDVKFQVTSNPVGFFTLPTVPVGTPGEISGVHSTVTGASAPPTSFQDAIIRGSGNGVFEQDSPGPTLLPEPGSLALVGLGLLAAATCRRRRAGASA